MNHELPDVQAGFKKGRGTRDQIANICSIMEKAREFQKNIYFCIIDYAKAFDCVHHNKAEIDVFLELSSFFDDPADVGSLKKQESSRKTSISALFTMSKPLTVWITINCGKF